MKIIALGESFLENGTLKTIALAYRPYGWKRRRRVLLYLIWKEYGFVLQISPRVQAITVWRYSEMVDWLVDERLH